jgi:hypothetical protein
VGAASGNAAGGVPVSELTASGGGAGAAFAVATMGAVAYLYSRIFSKAPGGGGGGGGGGRAASSYTENPLRAPQQHRGRSGKAASKGARGPVAAARSAADVV